jgi:hypothetical protein
MGAVMGRRLIFVTAFLLAIALGAADRAAAQCTRVGEEVCQSGEVYRCEKVGSELGLILQSRKCVVNVPNLNGLWRGTGHQSPAGSAGADWTIAMTIGQGGGSIEYPSLSCGGSLAQISRDATSAQYLETITFGQTACINGGTITVRYVNGKLAWTWFGQQGGEQYNAIDELTR